MDPNTLAEAFQYAPWAVVAALVLWPQKGIVALFLRNRHKERMKELERGYTHKELAEAVKRRSAQEQLPPPLGALPPPISENRDDSSDR